jgi:hypothetical protein
VCIAQPSISGTSYKTKKMASKASVNKIKEGLLQISWDDLGID